MWRAEISSADNSELKSATLPPPIRPYSTESFERSCSDTELLEDVEIARIPAAKSGTGILWPFIAEIIVPAGEGYPRTL